MVEWREENGEAYFTVDPTKSKYKL